MCGIIGYWGKEKAFPALVQGLKNLEYRGYDSFGFAALDSGKISIEKGVGKISTAELKDLAGSIGIAHTRWATHGGVTKINAHPHIDCKGQVAVVHNGIIENYQELKKELSGHDLASDTDTELIAHLIEDNLPEGFEEACRKAFLRLKGRNAFLAISSNGDFIAARSGSPLIVGIGKRPGKGGSLEGMDKADPGSFEDVFVASDVPAFLEKTKQVMYLDDGEMVAIRGGRPIFRNIKTGQEVQKRVITIDWDAKQGEKGEYAHFMIKEIMEQKETIARAINQPDEEILKVAELVNKANGIFFVGCGTAGHVCRTAEYMFSGVAGKHVNYIHAAEFANYKHFIKPGTLVIAISQSGETADTLEALEIAKERGAKIVSILNVMGSSMSRISDYVFLIHAGPEKAVASTKATTAQLAVSLLLAYAVSGRLKEGKRLLVDIAAKVNDMINPRYSEHIKSLAEMIYKQSNVFIIGRGFNYPIALESALKIMEVSYIHAQGFPGGELKHGPLALIEKGVPVIVLTANDPVKEHIISNASEIKARGGYMIGIGPENNEVFDYWIKTPEAGTAAAPIVNLIPVQILAYYLAILNGKDPDYPRSLAKSVTTR